MIETGDAVAFAPALHATHLREAHLYANRTDMLNALALPLGGVVAEIGVAHGEFSEAIHKAMRPRKFVAFDLFKMHEHEVVWGVPSSSLLNGMTHVDFYRHRFSSKPCEIVLEVGQTEDTLPRYTQPEFDFIYVDAGHTYREVKIDAQHVLSMVKPNGLLIFNDYTFYDHVRHVPYGVVRAVNELVVSTDWKIVGLALDPSMFCDIALRR